ncbi:hypothetical protein [Williamsia sp. M5A3_1d]
MTCANDRSPRYSHPAGGSTKGVGVREEIDYEATKAALRAQVAASPAAHHASSAGWRWFGAGAGVIVVACAVTVTLWATHGGTHAQMRLVPSAGHATSTTDTADEVDVDARSLVPAPPVGPPAGETVGADPVVAPLTRVPDLGDTNPPPAAVVSAAPAASPTTAATDTAVDRSSSRSPARPGPAQTPAPRPPDVIPPVTSPPTTASPGPETPPPADPPPPDGGGGSGGTDTGSDPGNG